MDVKLGDLVRDTITDLEGIVVAITDWIYGCRRISVQPKTLKDGRPVDNVCFDVDQLEILEAAAVRVPATTPPTPKPDTAPEIVIDPAVVLPRPVRTGGPAREGVDMIHPDPTR